MRPRERRKIDAESHGCRSSIGKRPPRSLSLQLHVLVRRGERPAGGEPEAGLRHPRAMDVEKPGSQIGAYMALSCTSCWFWWSVASRRFRSVRPPARQRARRCRGTPRRRRSRPRPRRSRGGSPRSQGAADAVDEILQFLLLVRLEEGGPLERPGPRADSRRLQVPGQRFTHGGGRGIAPEIAGVESLRIARLGRSCLALAGS